MQHSRVREKKPIQVLVLRMDFYVGARSQRELAQNQPAHAPDTRLLESAFDSINLSHSRPQVRPTIELPSSRPDGPCGEQEVVCFDHLDCGLLRVSVPQLFLFKGNWRELGIGTNRKRAHRRYGFYVKAWRRPALYLPIGFILIRPRRSRISPSYRWLNEQFNGWRNQTN